MGMNLLQNKGNTPKGSPPTGSKLSLFQLKSRPEF